MNTKKYQEYTDLDRREFLDALDADPNITVNDWEAQFIESTIARQTFSPAQRVAIDKMMTKYDVR